MRTIMAKTPHDYSFSKRYFQWRKKGEDEDDDEEALTSFSSSQLRVHEDDVINGESDNNINSDNNTVMTVVPPSKKKVSIVSVSRFRSVLSVFGKHRSSSSLSLSLGTRVVGTLFGFRKGHVNFAFQEDPKSYPAFFIELATPTSSLIREMASGLVRIALECDRNVIGKKGIKLLEENLWRTYCNGKKCGFAMRRECGAAELKLLKALEPVTMGAGVLPGNGANFDDNEEIMFMRAKFERVKGSRDSEALYMMNPEGSGGPELSIFLLRV